MEIIRFYEPEWLGDQRHPDLLWHGNILPGRGGEIYIFPPYHGSHYFWGMDSIDLFSGSDVAEEQE